MNHPEFVKELEAKLGGKIVIEDASTWETRNTGKFPVKFYQVVKHGLPGSRPTVVSSFWLSMMPGCCGLAVSFHACVYEPFRNKGVGTILNRLRMVIAKDLGYSALICTDVAANKHQRNILRKNNWKDIYQFINRRTGNKVFLSAICLKEKS